MSSERIAFNKENIDGYFHELAKEFRKLNGKSIPAEIILIGGAAVIANYGFREMTYDVHTISTVYNVKLLDFLFILWYYYYIKMGKVS